MGMSSASGMMLFLATSMGALSWWIVRRRRCRCCEAAFFLRKAETAPINTSYFQSTY